MADYVLVDTWPKLEAAVDSLTNSRVVSYDLETTGLDPLTDSILLWGFRGDNAPINFITANHEYAEALVKCLRYCVFLAHNALFEYSFTKVNHTNVPMNWFDTMLAEQLLTAGLIDVRHDLDGVVRKYCGNVHGGKELQKSFINANPETFVATDEQLRYLADDVAFLHDVMYVQCRNLYGEGLLRVTKLEMAALPAFGEMQLNGFYLNLDKHAAVLQEYVTLEGEARTRLEAALQPLWEAHLFQANAARAVEYQRYSSLLDGLMAQHSIKRLTKETDDSVREQVLQLRKQRDKYKPIKVAPINIGSTDQVLAAMKVAGVEPQAMNQDTGKMQPSLDKNVLREMQHIPLIKLYGEWSKPAKVVSTYGETLRNFVNPRTGRVHAGYRQCGAASGRTSSTSPNQQNEPPAVRHCFEAQQGNVLIVADAKNQEGRLAAALSGDEVLLDVFRQGIDWHSLTAAAAWPEKYPGGWESVDKESEERARAKNGNFSSIYGGTGHTLYSRGYVDDLATGDRIMEAIATTYPTLAAFSQLQASLALSRGWVQTISGRKRYFRIGEAPVGDAEEMRQWKRKRGGIRRSAMNHPVQGSGADVMKQAMILLLEPLRRLGYGAVAMVHDELVYEGPAQHAEEAKQLILDKMEEAGRLFTTVIPIPGEAKVTQSWKK